MSTVVEIESAIEKLPLPEKREVFDFLTERLEAEAGEVTFPDLKALLLEVPTVGTDADFARVLELPRDLDLSVSGYLLDTNVVSELRKGLRGDPGLAAWFAQRNRRELFLSAVTLAELRRGIALLENRDPEQAETLRRWCDRVQRDFGRTGRLLPIRAAEAAAWGELMALRPLPIMDGFLAATAKVHDLTLTTRNEVDFAGLSIRIENPFSGTVA